MHSFEGGWTFIHFTQSMMSSSSIPYLTTHHVSLILSAWLGGSSTQSQTAPLVHSAARKKNKAQGLLMNLTAIKSSRACFWLIFILIRSEQLICPPWALKLNDSGWAEAPLYFISHSTGLSREATEKNCRIPSHVAVVPGVSGLEHVLVHAQGQLV